ncbi:unannotated protein [freshwater metagenome]|uniref:Unannotated protein n=1 Tax=freshwater metagenome TaxID=449393 RepID=A0A6J6DNV4_9ZZZZ
MLQEVDDFGDVLLDAFISGDVGKGGSRAFRGVRLGFALANGHDSAHLPGRTSLHPHEETNEQKDREQQWDQGAPNAFGWRGVLDSLFSEEGLICISWLHRTSGRELRSVIESSGNISVGVIESGFFDLATIEIFDELAIGNLSAWC